MATFVLIHGAGGVGWHWHLVAPILREAGHNVVAPDLPCEDQSATLMTYADTVIDAIDDRQNLVVVGHSYGGFTAPLVASRLEAQLLVFAAAMVPAPGERPVDWWNNTGYGAAVEHQARLDHGLTGSEDPLIAFYHDLSAALATEAVAKERSESAAAYNTPWPLDRLPSIPIRFVAFTEDRFFPIAFMRRLATERLGIAADEIEGGHCAALSHPDAVAHLLLSYIQPHI